MGWCFRGCSSLNCRGQVAEFDISAGFRRAGVGRNNPFAGKELGNIAFSPDETGHTISAESQPRRAVRRRGEAGNQEKGPAGGGATNGGRGGKIAPGQRRAFSPTAGIPGSNAGRRCFQASNRIGAKGFEPSTSWSQTRRSNQAELRPVTRPLRPSAKVYPKSTENQSGAGFPGSPCHVSPRSAPPEDPGRRRHGDRGGGHRGETSPPSWDRWRYGRSPDRGYPLPLDPLWLTP